MKAFTDLLKRFQRTYTDVVGVDVGSTSVKAVRLRTINRKPTVVAADLLGSVSIPTETEAAAAVQPLGLSKPLCGRYVALAYSGPGAMVKLLTFPAHSDKTPDTQVSELMGLADSSDYRVAYETVTETRAEVRVLAVAMPDVVAHRLCQLFPSGTPAPCSVEVAGLSGITAFERGPGRQHLEEAVALVDFGAAVSTVAFYNKGVLALIRKFDFGMAAVLKKVQESLGVDPEVAMGILSDGSFDVSHVLHQAMESFLQQAVISRDFVERRDNCRVSHLYVCGGAASLKPWVQTVSAAAGLDPVAWNPFDGMAVAPNAIPEHLKGQEPRFASALGAALAVLTQG